MEEKRLEEEKSWFKKYLLCIKKGWLIVLILTLICSLTGFIIANFTFSKPYVEENFAVLNFRYKENVQINYLEIVSKDNIDRCKKITKSLETGKNISTYQYVDIDETKDIKIEKKDNYYTIYCNPDCFNVSSDGEYSDAVAKGFLKHLTLLVLISDEEIEEYNNSNLSKNEVFNKFDKEFYEANSLVDKKLIIEYADPNAIELNKDFQIKYYSLWILSFTLFGLVVSLIFIFIFKDKLDTNLKKEYDNKEVYKTPFHISFFKDSIKVFRDVKSLTLMGAILGLVMVCKFIPIPSGFGQLGIGLSYLFLSIGSMIFGPIPSIIMGALSDILGFVIKPSGTFFFGYTLNAMISCFTYALCFHKSYITFTRCLVARVIVNLFVNVILGSIWWAMMNNYVYEAFVVHLLTISLPKNLVYLLPQSLLLFFVLKAVSMPLYQMNLMDEKISHSFSFF